jgi:trimeric autotransporter adhesin
MIKFNYWLPSFVLSLIFTFSTNAQVSVVKDIFAGTKGACADTFSMMTVGTRTFLSANNGVVGNELWVTDGTEAGTRLVKDIYAGAVSSNPQYFMQLNNTLYFFATNAANGTELWKSDGTDAGTVLVKDIYAGAFSSFFRSFSKTSTIVFNNQLFFIANTQAEGVELWKTDGTTAGTVLVKDIDSGFLDSDPSLLTVFNNKLYFLSKGGLWQSDGTTVGTTLAKAFTTVYGMVVYKNELFVGASVGSVDDVGLWKINGAVSTLINNINTIGNSFGLVSYTKNPMFIVYGDYIYFSKRGAGEKTELWRSDGTIAGTSVFKTFEFGAGGYAPQNFRIANNTLMFIAKNENSSPALFRTDGTLAGTVEVKTSTNTSFSFNFIDFNFLVHKDRLYMAAKTSLALDLWRTDGTNTGTINVGMGDSPYGLNPRDFVSLGDKLLFRGETLVKGFELMGFNLSTPTVELPIHNDNVQIVPNPIQGEVTFDVKLAENSIKEWTFAISNSNGQIVKSGKMSGSTQKLNCSDIPNGFYILKIETSHWQSLKKVVVQH